MIRKAFRMRVNPDAHAEYERRHRPIWAELADTLRAHGVRDYSIFLDEATHDLFAYAEIESEERWHAIASTPVCQRWWAHMRDLMPTHPDGSPQATDLREVFHLPRATDS
jgi:L-rhamnose mutarotase